MCCVQAYGVQRGTGKLSAAAVTDSAENHFSCCSPACVLWGLQLTLCGPWSYQFCVITPKITFQKMHDNLENWWQYFGKFWLVSLLSLYNTCVVFILSRNSSSTHYQQTWQCWMHCLKNPDTSSMLKLSDLELCQVTLTGVAVTSGLQPHRPLLFTHIPDKSKWLCKQ